MPVGHPGAGVAALQRSRSSAPTRRSSSIFPDNPVALAESAVAAADDDRCREAMEKLQRAMAASGEVILHRVYEAIGVVADALIDNNEWLAAPLAPPDAMRSFGRRRGAAPQTAGVEPLGEDPLALAQSAGRSCRRRTARLGQSLERGPGTAWPPGVVGGHCKGSRSWPRNFPTRPWSGTTSPWCECWGTDHDGAIAALRKYAALDVPLDDAVEAGMLAMALSGDPLGDLVEMVNLAWTVSDAERLGEALLSEPRAVQLRFDPAAASDGQTPPPRMIFLLLDRALRPRPRASRRRLCPTFSPRRCSSAARPTAKRGWKRRAFGPTRSSRWSPWCGRRLATPWQARPSASRS